MGESFRLWPLPPYPLIPRHAKKEDPPPQQPSSSQQPTSSPQPVPASSSGKPHCQSCTCQNRVDVPVPESTHHQVYEPVVVKEQYINQDYDDEEDEDDEDEDIGSDCADDSESSWEPSDGEESDDLDNEVEEAYK